VDRNRFRVWFDEFDVVPVWRDVIADDITPVAAFEALRGCGERFVLESGEVDRSRDRFSFVGAGAALTMTRERGRVRLRGLGLEGLSGESTKATLEAVLRRLRAPRVPGMPPLCTGLVGVLGAGSLQPWSGSAGESSGLRSLDALLLAPRTVVAFDHLRQTVRVIHSVFKAEHRDADEAFAAAASALDGAIGSLRRRRPPRLEPIPSFENRIEIATEVDDDAYGRMLLEALDRVVAGEVEQLAVSRRYRVDAEVAPLDVYRMLRIMNPSPYMYLLAVGGIGVVGSSPQSLVRLRDGLLGASAIGGSSPRGADSALDAAYARALVADPKEASEHRQLVAQARGDLAHLLRPGSIEVDPAPSVQLLSHIMHLVTTIRGELREDVSPLDVLAATVPAGTVCGSPRREAMRIGREIEGSSRGLYGGAVGYLDLCGDVDACIGIRTLFVEGRRYWSQAGASVVLGSEPAAEVRESAMKVKALFAAVAAAKGLREAAAGRAGGD